MSNPLLRTVRETIPAVSTHYDSLGLRDNPFPLEPGLVQGSPDPRLNGEIYCEELYADKQEDFDKLLIPSRLSGQPRSIAFLMDHATRRGRGIGKSAFLNHQKERILADFGEKASEGTSVIFAVQVTPQTTPSCRKFWEFCRLITETLIDQDILTLAKWRLRALSGRIPDEVLQEIGDSSDWPRTIGNDSWLRERNVEPLLDVDIEVEKQVIGLGVPPDVAHLLVSSNSAAQFRQHILSRFTSNTWRQEGGKLVFDYLVKYFLAAKFTRGVLLIDEVEKIVYHQTTVERRAFVESCRSYLIDGDCENARRRFYGMLFTIHPGIQEILLPHWKSAGLDRLAPLAEGDASESTVYFGPLKPEMALPLIKVYLDHYKLSPDNTIHPFTEEAVIEALVRSGGVPRPTLKLLHRVIEEAAKQGVEAIGKPEIEKALSTKTSVEAEEMEEFPLLPESDVDLRNL
jgi:hypothetical protein